MDENIICYNPQPNSNIGSYNLSNSALEVLNQEVVTNFQHNDLAIIFNSLDSKHQRKIDLVKKCKEQQKKSNRKKSRKHKSLSMDFDSPKQKSKRLYRYINNIGDNSFQEGLMSEQRASEEEYTAELT